MHEPGMIELAATIAAAMFLASIAYGVLVIVLWVLSRPLDWIERWREHRRVAGGEKE